MCVYRLPAAERTMHQIWFFFSLSEFHLLSQFLKIIYGLLRLSDYFNNAYFPFLISSRGCGLVYGRREWGQVGSKASR